MKKNFYAKNGNPHIRDLNSKTVFQEPELCAQFLRDNVELPLFQRIRAEDIEDVSQRLQPYVGTEFFGDTVKKIKIADGNGEETSVYVISLIEHKSKVDYNIAMQILRYMVGIWREYEKTLQNSSKGTGGSRKGFCYPPIIPIVYYEGAESWTADLHFKDRILMSEMFEDYIPDFTYKVVRNHDYSAEELLSRKDAMSLLMLFNKLQRAEDWEEIRKLPKEKVDGIIQNTSDSVLEIIAATIWSLCRKMNVPEEETRQYVEQVKERNMGYLFENMEKIDIQEERRKCAEERSKREEEQRKREEEQRKREEEQRKREEEQRKREEEQQKREEAEQTLQKAIMTVVEAFRESGADRETIVEKLMQKVGISSTEAEKAVDGEIFLPEQEIKKS